MARATFTDNTAPDSPTRTESRFRPTAATSRTDLLTVKNLTDSLSRHTSQILLPLNSNTLGDRPNQGGADFRRHDIRVEPESGGTAVFLDITDGIFALSRPTRNRFHNTAWEPLPSHRIYLGYDTDGNPLPNGPYYFYLNYGENHFSNSLINPGDTRATFVINGVSQDYTGFIVDDNALLDIATGSRMTVNLPVTIYEGRNRTTANPISFIDDSGDRWTNQEMNIWRLQNNNENSHLRMTINSGYYANRDLSYRVNDTETLDIVRFPTAGYGGTRWNSVTHEWQVGHNVSTRDVLYRGTYVYWRANEGRWAAPTEGGFISDNGIRLIIRNNLNDMRAGVDVPARTGVTIPGNPLNFGRFDNVFNMQVLTPHHSSTSLGDYSDRNSRGAGGLYIHSTPLFGPVANEDTVGQDNGRVLIDMQPGSGVTTSGVEEHHRIEETTKVVFRNMVSVPMDSRWGVRNGHTNIRGAIFEHQTAIAGRFLDSDNNPVEGARVRLRTVHPSYYPDTSPSHGTAYLAFDQDVSALAVTDSDGNFEFSSSNGLLYNDRDEDAADANQYTDVAVVVEALRLAGRQPDDDSGPLGRSNVALLVDNGYQIADTNNENNVRYRHNGHDDDHNLNDLSIFAFGFKFVIGITVQLPRAGGVTGAGVPFEGRPVFDLPQNLERDTNLRVTEPRPNPMDPRFPSGPEARPNLVRNTQDIYDAVYSEAFRQGIENPLTIENGAMRIADGQTIRLENLPARVPVVEVFNNIWSVNCSRTVSRSTLTDTIIGALETPSVTLDGISRTRNVTSTDFSYRILNYSPDYTISMYTAEENAGVIRINNLAPFYTITNRPDALRLLNGISHTSAVDTLVIDNTLSNFPNGAPGVSQDVSFGTGTGQTTHVVLVAGSPTGGVYKRVIDTQATSAGLVLDLATTPQRPNTVDVPTGWTVAAEPIAEELDRVRGSTTDSQNFYAEVLANYSSSGWSAPNFGVPDFQPWEVPINFTAVPESTTSLTDAQTAALLATVRDDPVFLEWVAFIIDPDTNGTTDFFYSIGGRNAYTIDPNLVQLRVGSGVDSSRIIGLGYMDRINSVDPTAAIADYNLVGNIIVAAEPSAFSTEAVAETFQVSEQNIENAVDSAINTSGLVTNTDLVRARNTIIGNL